MARLVPGLVAGGVRQLTSKIDDYQDRTPLTDLLTCNRVGGCSLIEWPTSHHTVCTVRSLLFYRLYSTLTAHPGRFLPHIIRMHFSPFVVVFIVPVEYNVIERIDAQGGVHYYYYYRI